MLLKALSRGVAAVIVLVIVVVTVVYLRSNSILHRTFHVQVKQPSVPTDPASISAGLHVATTRGCRDCHGPDLSGAVFINNPAMGVIAGPNLTRGHGGIGAYSDQDFVRAIRHGVAADGHGLVIMPSGDYSRLTETDLDDLIAYVKSVPPVDRDNTPIRLGPVSRALIAVGKIKLAADVIDHDHVKADIVEPGQTAAYGRYLAVTCTGCHGDNFSGGKIEAGPPDWPPAANLTPDPSGHLSHWSEEDFVKALRTKRRPDGSEINRVMPSNFGQLTDSELKAIWLFLKTLPPAPTGVR